MGQPVEMSREYREEPITIGIGQSASSVLNLTRFAFGSVQHSAAIEGTIKWQVSLDGVTWTDAGAITHSNAKSEKIPDDVWSFPMARILASTNQTALRTFLTFRKG
jgi:hypothetical protein